MTTSPRPCSPQRARELAVKTDQLLGIDQIFIRHASDSQRTAEPVSTQGTRSSGKPSTTGVSPRTLVPAPPIESSDDGPSEQRLEHLRMLHEEQCPHCSQASSHQNIVFGEGNPDADLMFVGEAPGVEEDRTGRPFVGRAGQKLDEMIKAMGFTRDQVYIANVLKARPPENRTPLQHEVDACGPYLAAQSRIIKPQIIVALGGPAAKLLLKTETGITRLRGRWGQYDDGKGKRPVMPTFHPAYLLRNPTLEVRGQVWEDLKAVLDRMGRSVPG